MAGFRSLTASSDSGLSVLGLGLGSEGPNSATLVCAGIAGIDITAGAGATPIEPLQESCADRSARLLRPEESNSRTRSPSST